MPRYLLGLDAGTGSARALLVDVESGRTAVAVRPWSHMPVSEGGGWAYDFDVERNWLLLVEAVREVLQRATAVPAEVAGIAATSMRHNLVLLRDGQAVFAVPNQDARPSAEAMEMAAGRGEAFYRSTGRWPTPIFLLPRLKWLAVHHPEWLEGARALSIGDWVAFRLCGEVATDFSQAGESMIFDLHGREWMWAWIDELGLPRSLFPPVLPSGTLLGKLTPAAAGELGLPPGTPVATGGADTPCALLGLGTLRSGEVALIAGTTTPVQAVVDRPILDPDRRLWTGLHVLPDRWVVESNAGAMGEPLEWLAGLLYPDSPRPVAKLMAEAARARPGAGGLLSTFGAQVFHASAMGLPVGSITLCHFLKDADGLSRRRNLVRAVLEGMACALRANLEQISALAGTPSSIYLGGGMSHSPFWGQLLADVLGRPLLISEVAEASALGAAICAGAGAGVFRDLAEGSEKLARTRSVAPAEEAAQTYVGVYAGWQSLRASQAASCETAAGLVLQTLAEERPGTARPARFRPKMFVTAQVDEESLARLRRLGEVEYAPYRETLRVLTGEDLVEALQGAHVLVTEVDVVDLEALERLPDLRVVISCRGRAVNVDLAACTALGVPVLHTPGRNADAVADLTVALMLALLRKLIPADDFLRRPGGEAGDLSRMGQAHKAFLGRELWGKTVGLVGLGAVGRAVARRLSPFGVRLLAYDPYLRPGEAEEVDAEAVSLERLLSESDIVSLHAPVTEETQGLIGREGLARMKPGAFLVNTARAALVDEEALLEALRSGHLAGAALDVFSIEPPASDHPLLALDSVIATPHIGGNTEEVAAHQGRMVVEELERMLAGEKPHHILNPEALEGFSWEGPRRPVERAALEALSPRTGPAVSDLQQAAAPPLPEPASTPPPSAGGRSQVERILRLFCEKAREDAALNAFAAKRQAITHYTLTDLGLEFHIGFQEGRVVADVGAPPKPAEVRMKATAETLDGIFTGRVSGTKAAMSGKLAFSGDVRLAMGLQRIQGDLIRLYTAAREEAGGIDFSALVSPGQPPAGSEDPRPEMVQVIGELYQLGLITATGGNVSARIVGREECWITPSRLYKGDLRPEMMVRIDFAGNALDEGAPAPSSERAVHTELYRARPEVGAVIHAHAPYATALALSGRPFLPVTTEAAFLGKVPVVPFIMPGTRELAQAVVKAMGKSPACILQNHGVVVAAGTLRRAADLVEMLERTAQLILACYAVGKRPAVLPKEVARMLGEMEVL